MEEWRDIKGYEGLYQISNLGRVKSLPRKIRNQHCKNEYIKTPIPDKDGYLRVTLYDRGRNKTYAIHKLVAIHFLDNPNNFPIINHKNEIRSDNRVENLEWCTNSENQIHAYKNGLKVQTEEIKKKIGLSRLGKYKGRNSYNCKKVKCVSTGEVFYSLNEAGEKYNISPSSITECCRGRHKTAKGLKWEYVEG